MIQKISVCGKGGSGKSVLITLLAKILRDNGHDILVVDTDESNTGLYKMLDFADAPEALSNSLGGRKGVSKYWQENRLLDLIQDTIKRKGILTKDRIGLLSIGKIVGAGEGCACPLNALVRAFLQTYEINDNEILLLDTEAGVEHLGRGNERYVDAIIIVVDPSTESLDLAKRAKDLAIKLGIPDERLYVVTNKIDSSTNEILVEGLRERRLDSNLLGSMRFDSGIQRACLYGSSLINYTGDTLEDVKKIAGQVFPGGE